MARTAAQASKLEAKAKAMSSKSEGMRFLFENGYTVVEVKNVYGAPYGFVYGVADRAGLAEKAAARRAPRKERKAKAPVARVTKSEAGRPTVTKVAARGTKVSTRKGAEPQSASAKVAARLQAAKPGRPSAERRQANRKRTATKA